jgi:hypothetical protein
MTFPKVFARRRIGDITIGIARSKPANLGDSREKVEHTKKQKQKKTCVKHEIKAEEERFRNVTPGDNQGIPEVKPGPKRSYHTYRQTARAAKPPPPTMQGGGEKEAHSALHTTRN